jgi:hypothetical protein
VTQFFFGIFAGYFVGYVIVDNFAQLGFSGTLGLSAGVALGCKQSVCFSEAGFQSLP